MKFKWPFYFLAIILALLLPVLTQAVGPVLYRALVVGSTGEDVRELQRWLNGNGFVVASFGPGSPGQETAYYGQLTAAAYARYQSSLSSAPNNLNLPAGCTVYTLYSPLTGVKCDSGQASLATPIVLGSTAGQNSSQPQAVLATDGLNSLGIQIDSFVFPPEIPLSKTMGVTAVSPASGARGTEVVISGYGFNRYKNQVYTGFGVVEVGSTDGKTLKFRLDPLEQVELATKSNVSNVLAQYDISDDSTDIDPPSLPKVTSNDQISLYVVTSGGRSTELFFKLEQ